MEKCSVPIQRLEENISVKELDNFKTVLLENIREFIDIVQREYNITLTFSKSSLPKIDNIIEQIKNSGVSMPEVIVKGSVYFLTGLLLEYFKGEIFKTEIGYGLRLLNAGIDESVELHPVNWINKRIRYGKSESIAFKFEVLLSKTDEEPRLTSEWPEDKSLAKNFARKLGVLPQDEKFINDFIQEMLEDPEKITRDLLDTQESILGEIIQNGKSYKYLLGRIYKIHFFVIKLKFKHGSRKFSEIFKILTLKNVKFLTDEYAYLLEYIKNVPFGVNDNIFEQLFQMERITQLFKKGNLQSRNLALISLLELNGRKLYHHNIKEFKKIIKFIIEDNEAVIKYLATYQVEYQQGCYKAIEHILSYKFKVNNVFDNFSCQRYVIIWLDNAIGKEPKQSWIDKLIALEQKGMSQDLMSICHWILSHNELKYDEINKWLDTAYSHFEKSAKWYINRTF